MDCSRCGDRDFSFCRLLFFVRLNMAKFKTKKEVNKPADELQERLQKDFIVKNMPAFSSFSGTNFGPSGEAAVKNLDLKSKDRPNSARSTGIIIVSAGLVVIAVLFYLAYRFLIVPAMKTNIPAADGDTKTTTSTPVTETVSVPVTAEIATATIAVATATPTTTTSVVEKLNLPAVTDTDNDGLSDMAETLLGTNPQAADSDNDGYSDKQEILSGYNPSGAGKLGDISQLALYTAANNIFAVVYPNTWTATSSASSTLFSAPDQSFIQVSYEDSEQDNVDILSWYYSQFPEDTDLNVGRLLVGNMGAGILSADQQIAYFLAPDHRHVYVVSYIKSGDAVPYLEIFKLMAATLMIP